MESQPQNPEFRNIPENFHPCVILRECPYTIYISSRTDKALLRLMTDKDLQCSKNM